MTKDEEAARAREAGPLHPTEKEIEEFVERFRAGEYGEPDAAYEKMTDWLEMAIDWGRKRGPHGWELKAAEARGAAREREALCAAVGGVTAMAIHEAMQNAPLDSQPFRHARAAKRVIADAIASRGTRGEPGGEDGTK